MDSSYGKNNSNSSNITRLFVVTITCILMKLLKDPIEISKNNILEDFILFRTRADVIFISISI